jgi:beta-N-acetylhexosaminidase
MINRIGIATLWFFGLLFVFAGINKNDPYLISLRGTGNVALAVTGITVSVALIRRGYWCRPGVAAKLLILLWCFAPISMLGAHIAFEARKRDVLQTEVGPAHTLGRHFIVGYSSFDEVAALAEKGLIAGVYITGHNLSGRTAEALTSEIAALQAPAPPRRSSTAHDRRRPGGRHRLASVAGADKVAGAFDARGFAAGTSRAEGGSVRENSR